MRGPAQAMIMIGTVGMVMTAERYMIPSRRRRNGIGYLQKSPHRGARGMGSQQNGLSRRKREAIAAGDSGFVLGKLLTLCAIGL